MAFGLEQIRFIIYWNACTIFFFNVYPVPSSTVRRTARWYARKLTFEQQQWGERRQFRWNVERCWKICWRCHFLCWCHNLKWCSATTPAGSQLSTTTWTKEHGMEAHSTKKKTKYMIIGTRQKLSRREECASALFLDDTEETWTSSRGTPSRSGYWPHPFLVKPCNKSEEDTFKARCCSGQHEKNSSQIKYHIILFNASIKPILEYCVSLWESCNVGQLADIFKVQKRCACLILDAPFQART